jgi:hypothetical protein
LLQHPGETNPKKLIKRLAHEKVAYAKKHGWEGPPFCPKIFTSIFDIRCREVDIEIGGEGRILPHPGGRPVIEYRKGRLLERQRFTIFHEFAHTLFPDFCEYRHPLNHASPRKLADPEKDFEKLCDIAAAEMLLPHEDFRDDLTKLEPLSFETVHHLRQRYTASIDATTHRLVELADTVPCTAVFLTDQRGNHSGRGPLWVKYSCCNSLFKGYIQPGITPPQNSVGLQCFNSAAELVGPARETWWINGKPRTWLAQAAKLPEVPENPDYAKVVVLLFPSGYGKG